MDTKNRRKGDRRAVKDLPARKTQDVNRDAAEAHHETIERRCARALLGGSTVSRWTAPDAPPSYPDERYAV